MVPRTDRRRKKRRHEGKKQEVGTILIMCGQFLFDFVVAKPVLDSVIKLRLCE